MQEILNKILEAKEQRFRIKKEYGKAGYSVISINFNIPGYPKTNKLLTESFAFVCKELENYLQALRIPLEKNKIQNTQDEVGNICFYPFKTTKTELSNIKNKLEEFEQSHELGRILDVDLFDSDARPISSGKQKNCFICKNKSALQCMRAQTHSHKELRDYIQQKSDKYLSLQKEKKICRQLASFATWAILTEVSLPDELGLVSPQSNGSHRDMNYQHFLASSSVISSYFYEIAQNGYRWNGENKEKILTRLRMIGLQMESDMFTASFGVNTQKGIIFLITFSLFVSGYVLSKNVKFDTDLFRKVLKNLAKDLVSKELQGNFNKNNSHGEKCYNKYGSKLAGGIRREVEWGLPLIFNEVLPYMKKINLSVFETSNLQEFNNKCKLVLLKIISVNNDTNILYRSNAETLALLQKKSGEIINIEDLSERNRLYKKLSVFCIEKNISPGGSADMFALSLFLKKIIENKYNTND